MTRYLLTILLCLAMPVAGIAGGAIDFDGADDYITGDDTGFPSGSSARTIGMWLNVHNTTAGRNDVLLTYGSNIGGKISLFTSLDGAGVFSIGFSGDRIGTTTRAFTQNVWHHLVFVIPNGVTTTAPGNFRVYIDAQLKTLERKDGSQQTLNTLLDGDYDIGGVKTSNFFDGEIKDFCVHDFALTQAEVEAMYASGGAWYPARGLAVRLSMDNNGVSTGQSHANGSTINDSHGSNDGTVNDGADGSMTLESSPVRQKRGRR